MNGLVNLDFVFGSVGQTEAIRFLTFFRFDPVYSPINVIMSQISILTLKKCRNIKNSIYLNIDRPLKSSKNKLSTTSKNHFISKNRHGFILGFPHFEKFNLRSGLWVPSSLLNKVFNQCRQGEDEPYRVYQVKVSESGTFPTLAISKYPNYFKIEKTETIF